MAGEKGLMHCFYFTPVASATQADWQGFFKPLTNCLAALRQQPRPRELGEGVFQGARRGHDHG